LRTVVHQLCCQKRSLAREVARHMWRRGPISERTHADP
jgi:hypothetical protein